MDTYISELDQAKFSQGVDNLPADLVGDVQLHHAHMSGAEWSIPRWSHLVDDRAPAVLNEGNAGVLMKLGEQDQGVTAVGPS
jgi:hypothetical protein